MERKRIRVFFVPGVGTKFIDLFGISLEKVNKKMAVENEEMVSFEAGTSGNYYWIRKHIHDWEELTD